MFSQTSLTTRRQFLERSMLGFGSAFLLPSLLASCTDHVLPPSDPGQPVFPPLVGDFATPSFNDTAKTFVTTGLGMVPEVGVILGPLVGLFWPDSGDSPWDEVKAQVEALIDQKIDALVYQQVTEDLSGFNDLMTDYISTMQDGTNDEKRAQFIAARGQFDVDEPHFKSAGYELLLLPLYAQFVNMRLSVLRDAVLKGQDWGRTPADLTDDIKNLQKHITAAATYTQSTVDNFRKALESTAPIDCAKMEPLRTLNTFDRQMYLTVLDFKDMWKYFDPTVYPGKVEVQLDRVIYADPIGTGTDSGCGYMVYSTWPTQPISQISAWSNDYIDAFQLIYPANGGPGGITDTGVVGYYNAPGAFKRTYNISPTNPIVAVNSTWGTVVNTMQFVLADGTQLDVLGSKEGASKWTWQYDSERLSNIILRGVNYVYNSAFNVLLGFQYWQSPTTFLRGVRDIYIKSPKEHTAADFSQAFPKLGITADLITNELKDARKTYWERLKARAKKPK